MFGFKCEECGRGTVQEARRNDFEVRFNRIPFVVPDAVVGVCDSCGAVNFDGREYKRWRRLFDEHQARTGGVLSPGEIRELRAALSMTMSDFSALIGTTRQSLHHWEKDDREVPQSRMVDLMLRLVQEAVRRGAVDVVAFLADNARQADIQIRMPSLARARVARARRQRGPDPSAYDGLYQIPRGDSQVSPCLHLIARAA
jgi:putative zinc finger/helix-turn-helix YgiT family protein